MNIALDAMGGDFAPKAVIEGALLASKSIASDTKITLVGKVDTIKTVFQSLNETIPSNIELYDAPEVIEMGEHPVKALSQKTKSSISVGYKLLQNKEADAFCSAGNTGAMMIGAMFSVKVIDGIQRPCLISNVPQLSGKFGIILDVGANTDCKPEVLLQFGVLGMVYCKKVFNIENPRVALLNLGHEEQKGNIQVQAAYPLFKNHRKINFVGNIEGRDLFSDMADVIVCDGFVGNIVIKMAESYYEILRHKQYKDPFFDNFNFEIVGGSPILGINGNVIIAHGISNAKAIQSAIHLTERVTKASLYEDVKKLLME